MIPELRRGEEKRMIRLAEPGADIFAQDAQALVNPVNCVGVSGKGLAKDFRDRYPMDYQLYRQACESGLLGIGRVFTTCENPGGLLIINLPTKNHWRNPSRLEDITASLSALFRELELLDVTVAVPALGCGNGGLSWDAVRPEINRALADLPNDVLVIPPRADTRVLGHPGR